MIRDNYCVETGQEAIELLISSDKIIDVCLFSLEDSKYNLSDNQIVLREWKASIPLSAEFRGFVWEGNLNAICPYYHWFYFNELIGQEEKIKLLISTLYETEIKPKLSKTLINCQIDFAIFGNDDVKIIEINPFDGKNLGSFPISTGLFLIDNKNDLEIIKNGPLQIRLRKHPLSDSELKFRLESSLRQALKQYI